jgi:transketolase
MRNAFADEMTKLGAEDPRAVLLSGDIGNKLFDKFKAVAPTRFFNCGVAEANMMSVAAGLALNGLRPVVYTITPFTTTRCFEQIRVDVCYHDAPVVIVGTGSGLSYAELGPTHHSLEDLAILRTLPGMTVVAPCDEVELRLLLRAAFAQKQPMYMRIGKKGEPVLHAHSPDLVLGKAITLRQGQAPGNDVCFVAAGTVMPEVLAAADALAALGYVVRVESFHTIKPLDERTLAEVFATSRMVAVVEEHGLIGGLSGAVAEWQADAGLPHTVARMLRFGARDEFLHAAGSQSWARGQYQLEAADLVARICAAL